MNSKLMYLVAALFGCSLLLSAFSPLPSRDYACSVYWVADSNGDIRVGCQQGSCGENKSCDVVETQVGTQWHVSCDCESGGSEQSNPLCKGTFIWDGEIEKNADGQPKNPDDWTCTTVNCTVTCLEEFEPASTVPAGKDTPCECEE